MFRYLAAPNGEPQLVTITIDGARSQVRGNETVAAAMLHAGCLDFRVTPVGGRQRGPYCMMGVCFDCLVTIDDQANQQACMTLVRAGMRIERQASAGSIVHVSVTTAGDGP